MNAPYSKHAQRYPSHEQRSRMVRMDDGRKLLGISTLAAGGAVATISVVSLAYAILYTARAPLHVDIIAASLGAIVSFVYLLKTARVFRRHDE